MTQHFMPLRITKLTILTTLYSLKNWLIRVMRQMYPNKQKELAPQDSPRKSDKKGKNVISFLTSNIPGGKRLQAIRKDQSFGDFRFHNHIVTNGGIDLREERSTKSSTACHRAVVPNSPLISRRFYDWPPIPSLSKVDVYYTK